MIWTVLGISVALVAGFSVALVELLVGRPFFEQHRVHIAIGLAVVGAGLLALGKHLASRRSEAEAPEAEKGFLLLDLRYWGPMLLLLAGITFFIQTIADRMEAIISQRVQETKHTSPHKVAALEPPEPPAPPAPRAPVKFPEMKVQGFILRETHSVVIFNGRPYGVGERVGPVTIKAISREAVTLELSGEEKRLPLDGVSSPGLQVTPAGK